MKLTWKQIDSFVRKPDPAARVILIYGPDAGLVRERASLIGKTIVADLNDPFNAVTLSGPQIDSDPARLVDEASAMSMLGGNRLIRVEDAGDSLTPILKDYLANPSPQNLIVLEAGNLGAKSPLRALCEKSAAAASLPCYVDEGRDLATLIRESLQHAGYGIDTDALQWLSANINGDRARIRSEIEKIVLYMGPAENDAGPEGPAVQPRIGTIQLADVVACCGEAGAQDLDDLVQAVAGSQPDAAMRYYNMLLQEGTAAVVILRSLQAHFRKLHLTQARMEQGLSAEEAMKRLSPPIFFKQLDAFKSQLRGWSMPQVESLLQRLALLEAQTKQTGTPVETLCAQAVLSMSRAARG
jgi:DNA polymerase-3 subunit delta